MYEIIQPIHSYIAYAALSMLIIAVFNAIIGMAKNKMFTPQKDFRVSLFTLILCHIQLLIGLILFFISPSGLNAIQELGMGGLTSEARLLAVEHPFINIIALVYTICLDSILAQ